MSGFPYKRFKGSVYTFDHLKPMELTVPLDAQASRLVNLHITFGCHCFTEKFDSSRHVEPHRYRYKGELRAFDELRYECSLQLPRLMRAMLTGTIYRAQDSYTYVAQITLESAAGPRHYSVFFNLEKDVTVPAPALRMFVKSAYLRPLVARQNAQHWRFPSLAGQISGAFPAKEKRPRPKKKAP